jgi:hypothetical protein
MIATHHLGSHHYMLMDTGDMAAAATRHMKWMHYQEKIQRGNGVVPTHQFLKMADAGDEAMVNHSDAYLSMLEDQMPMSRGWRNVDDVVGAIPNVPAYLAGHPQCMRRRERTSKDTAPLTIYMNLTSSMAIHQNQILHRGVVMLAMARVLANVRPVELWVGTSMGDDGVSCTAAWRIDTAPMDLARAAFHIAAPSMSRLFGYAMCEALVDKHIGGYLHQRDVHFERLKNVAGWNEVVIVPEILYSDPLTKDPVAWMKRELKLNQEDDNNV